MQLAAFTRIVLKLNLVLWLEQEASLSFPCNLIFSHYLKTLHLFQSHLLVLLGN